MKLIEYKKFMEEALGETISNSKIAKILGCSRQWVSDIRNDELSNENYKKLEKYLNNNLNKGIDIDVLSDIITIIEECLQSNNVSIIPKKKAELIALIYKLYSEGNFSDISQDNILPFMRIVS